MSNSQEPCNNCGHVHDTNELLNSLLGRGSGNNSSNRESYSVPEESKMCRPENDAVWNVIDKGPTKEEIDMDQDIDDLVTYYARNWNAALQGVHNMLSVLDGIVQKNELTKENREEKEKTFPPGILHIYKTGGDIAKIHDMLKKPKTWFFTMEKMRKDWGSINAFTAASEEEQKKWYDSRRETGSGLSSSDMLLMAALLSGIGGSRSGVGLAALAGLMSAMDDSDSD